MIDHDPLVRETFEIARRAGENGNYPFGALLAVDGEVVRTSENTVEADRDLTAHPELKLARWAARELDADRRRRVTLYASTEPCPMCAGAIYWSGVTRVVYGTTAAGAAEAGGGDLVPSVSCETVFDSGSIPIEAVGPVAESAGRELHRTFWSSADLDGSFVSGLVGEYV